MPDPTTHEDRGLCERILAGVSLETLGGRLLYANAPFVRMLGYGDTSQIEGEGTDGLFWDPADGERYVCAHTSMDITQKVIPCFDQPDIKSTFTVSVTAPSHWTVLANGALEDRTGSSEGDTWTFATTPPFSSET